MRHPNDFRAHPFSGHDRTSREPFAGPGRHGRRFHRRFRTREERIARLEEYLNELRLEAQAVEEHLTELRAAD